MTTAMSGRRPTVSDEVRYERAAMARVTAALCAEFADRVPPDAVQAAVAEARGQFQTARLREFVPILVERSARERLMTTASSTGGAERGRGHAIRYGGLTGCGPADDGRR
jgi:hypothetical protein